MIDQHDTGYQCGWRLLTDEEVENEPPDPAAGDRFKCWRLEDGLCCAAGLPQRAFAVKQGPVVVVEGVRDLGPQIRAWKHKHSLSGHLPDFHVLRGVTSLENGQAQDLVTYLQRVLPRPPAVLIIDTLPCMWVGDDKKSRACLGLPKRDMEQMANSLSECYVVLHHRSESAMHFVEWRPARLEPPPRREPPPPPKPRAPRVRDTISGR
jgi:hypothetical protein